MPEFVLRLLSAGLILCCCKPVLSADDSDHVCPDWIWLAETRHSPQRVCLQRSFQIDGIVQRADFKLVTEYTECEVRFGDRTAFILDDYGPWLDRDVTDFLRSGENLIQLRCTGSQGPSAVALELTVTTTDGRRITICSGADWQGRLADSESQAWQTARSFGAVSEEFLNADRTARITPFDNYEQWRQAAGEISADATKFLLQPGFEIQRVRSATDAEGSWVSLEFDPEGRLTIAREDKGLLRMTLSDDGSSVTHVETINDSLEECRGLLYLDGALYAQANNSKSLYRLDDADQDGQFENVVPVREFPGGVGHGRNDLTTGPNATMYAIFGDSVELPRENVTDLTSPFREARHGQRTTEGHVLRFQPDSGQWQLWCSGLRNPFGITFNIDGEAFTYDADAEFDMGSPWYRPTRLVQLVSGGDYGWRGRTNTWPPYDADHADFTLPAGDIGKGSPTAVKSGAQSSFPEQYRRAVFALDWAYGRILACHLLPRGAGYVCRAETFLKGRPLNVTDFGFAPDGSLYIITGGRKTHSDLYRIRWIGGDALGSTPTLQQAVRAEFAGSRRRLRQQLAGLHGTAADTDAVAVAMEWIGDADPLLRDAARVVMENQPVESWSQRALQETRPPAAVSCLLSLARSERDEFVPAILQQLLEVPLESLSGYDRSQLLETWSRCLRRPVARDAAAFEATVDRIRNWYPDLSPEHIPPTGAGRSVNHQLALLAEMLAIPDLVSRTLQLLAHSRTQEDQLHCLFVLRNCREGWTAESRRMVFETLGDLDRTVIGGEGMPGFLRKIREELTATLTDSERELLGDLLQPGTVQEAAPLRIDRPVVRKWQASDLPELLLESHPANVAHGRELFRAALCSRCHRAENTGGVIGPDLSFVANRFSRRDILLSILEPSRVVDEKYRHEQIVTTDGRVIIGRILTGGDYRATKLRISTDPLRPGEIAELAKSEIETHELSNQSPMPSGLLDTLAPEDIRSLLDYLELSATLSGR